MPRKTIAVWKDPIERGYRVGVQGKRDAKLFIWGTFDEGDVTWQEAKKQAYEYAKKEAAKIGGEIINLKTI